MRSGEWRPSIEKELSSLLRQKGLCGRSLLKNPCCQIPQLQNPTILVPRFSEPKKAATRYVEVSLQLALNARGRQVGFGRPGAGTKKKIECFRRSVLECVLATFWPICLLRSAINNLVMYNVFVLFAYKNYFLQHAENRVNTSVFAR